mmetsp:Transcript_363/g.756  ORF Transcript_363/g.756 Transcript_363/m.756 type:complete len:204 (+) Transcript_363:216-827(+)
MCKVYWGRTRYPKAAQHSRRRRVSPSRPAAGSRSPGLRWWPASPTSSPRPLPAPLRSPPGAATQDRSPTTQPPLRAPPRQRLRPPPGNYHRRPSSRRHHRRRCGATRSPPPSGRSPDADPQQQPQLPRRQSASEGQRCQIPLPCADRAPRPVGATSPNPGSPGLPRPLASQASHWAPGHGSHPHSTCRCTCNSPRPSPPRRCA